MNKFAKIKLSAELLEAAAGTIRSTALDKVRWNEDYRLECEDRWNDTELLAKLTNAGREIIDVAEQLVARIEELL